MEGHSDGLRQKLWSKLPLLWTESREFCKKQTLVSYWLRNTEYFPAVSVPFYQQIVFPTFWRSVVSTDPMNGLPLIQFIKYHRSFDSCFHGCDFPRFFQSYCLVRKWSFGFYYWLYQGLQVNTKAWLTTLQWVFLLAYSRSRSTRPSKSTQRRTKLTLLTLSVGAYESFW